MALTADETRLLQGPSFTHTNLKSLSSNKAKPCVYPPEFHAQYLGFYETSSHLQAKSFLPFLSGVIVTEELFCQKMRRAFLHRTNFVLPVSCWTGKARLPKDFHPPPSSGTSYILRVWKPRSSFSATFTSGL